MRSIAALCVVGLFVPSLCAADPFNEFRIPAHSWQSGTASFSMNASRYDASDAGTTDQTSKDRQARAFASLRLERAYDSDRLARGWVLAARHDLDVSRSEGSTSYDFSPVRGRETGWGRGPQEDVQVGAYLRAYRDESQLGLQLSANGFAHWLDGRSGSDLVTSDELNDTRSETRYSQQFVRYQYDASLSGTLGFGVVRDATVVQDVYVLERRLAEAGTLSRPLSAAGRANLAQLLSVTPELANVHERPARFMWREIERVLFEDGALADSSLGAYSQAYAQESYRVGPDWRRRTGHFAGLTLQGRHAHRISRSDERTTYRVYIADTLYSTGESVYAEHDDFEANRFDLGPSVEWHRPVGWRWQWDAFSQALMGLRTGEKGLQTQSGISAAWLVADRLQARGTFEHQREYRVPGSTGQSVPVDDWMVSTRLSLDYFLEDHLAVTASYTGLQIRSTTYPNYAGTLRRAFIRADNIYVGLTYRFLGRVSAPGLMGDMRPL